MGINEYLAPSLSNAWTPHKRTANSKIAGRLFQKKERHFYLLTQWVLANEVRGRLLATSVKFCWGRQVATGS